MKATEKEWKNPRDGYLYVQLHTGHPGKYGGSCIAQNDQRRAFRFVAGPDPTKMLNDRSLSWQNIPVSEQYTMFSLWSDLYGGEPINTGTLYTEYMNAGDTFTIPIGALTLDLRKVLPMPEESLDESFEA